MTKEKYKPYEHLKSKVIDKMQQKYSLERLDCLGPAKWFSAFKYHCCGRTMVKFNSYRKKRTHPYCKTHEDIHWEYEWTFYVCQCPDCEYVKAVEFYYGP